LARGSSKARSASKPGKKNREECRYSFTRSERRQNGRKLNGYLKKKSKPHYWYLAHIVYIFTVARQKVVLIVFCVLLVNYGVIFAVLGVAVPITAAH
jgi:hypothetical protein